MHRTLSTADLARALGISESSVRRMADAGDLEVHRTRGGHRRIPVAEAIRWIRETSAPVARPDLLGLSFTPTELPKYAYAEKLRLALEEGHASSVSGLLQAMYAAGTSIADICDGPVVAAMQSIGDRWPHDPRAIFIEHRATSLCIRALCQLRLSIPDPDEDAPQAIGCAPMGDPYLLPSLVAALVLHDCGFNETSLGPNTPLDVLSDAVEDERPAITWLSIGVPLESRTQRLEFERLATTAQRLNSALVIGGRHVSSLQTIGGLAIQRCQTVNELKVFALRVLNTR